MSTHKLKTTYLNSLVTVMSVNTEDLNYRSREMAQQLRALTAFPEVLSSVLSNHMVAHNHL